MATPKAAVLGPPPLTVQPVPCSPSSAPAAEQLALDLYATLTRAPTLPLSLVAGVSVREPVAAEHLELEDGGRVLLILVVDREVSDQALDAISRRVHRQQIRHPGMLAVCVARLDGEPSTALLQQHLSPSVPIVGLYRHQATQADTLQQVIASLARLLRDEKQGRPTVSITHAPADASENDNAALRIRHALARQSITAPVFHLARANQLPAPADEAEHGKPAWNHLLIAVVGEAFARNDDCLQQVLDAKAAGYPLLVVFTTERASAGAVTLIGNAPALRWRDNPDEVARSAALQWIKAQVFRREAARAISALEGPVPRLINHPPELLDFIIGEEPRSKLVMYPDPQLSVAERRVLSHAHRRLHLLTPTTAYGYLRREADKLAAAPVQTPLNALKVGMSVSSAALGADTITRVTQYHLQDVVVHTVRALLAAGARIAYGGRLERGNFTDLLAELVDSYGRSNVTDARLVCFQAACEEDPPDEEDWDKYLETVHLADADEARRIIPPPVGKAQVPKGLYYSDMRRIMCAELDASVVVGGADEPFAANEATGYRGRYPGVVEEAWRMLAANRPVYILGAFGGAAAAIAQLLLSDDDDFVPRPLRDDTWDEYPEHRALIDEHDQDDYRAPVGLPDTPRALIDELRRAGKELLGEDTAYQRNGLSARDNRTLLTTRDPLTIASLILRGLCRFTADRARRVADQNAPLRIELVHGSVLDSEELNAISVPVAADVPIAGAAADVGKWMSDRIEQAAGGEETIITVGGEALAADFVHLARITTNQRTDDADPSRLPIDIRPAIRNACAQARRFGFSRLGVVLYGASLLGNAKNRVSQFERLIDIMVEEFASIAGSTTLVWHEIDHERFTDIRKHLEKHQGVVITTVHATGLARAHARPQECLGIALDLRDEDTTLDITVSAPDGTAVVARKTMTIEPREIDRLAKGVKDEGDIAESPPLMAHALERGAELSEMLFGGRFDEVLEILGEREVRITLNDRASRIPLELLTHDQQPLTTITRRLAVRLTDPNVIFRRRAMDTMLKVLVIADPASNLPLALEEGRQVYEQLADLPHVQRDLLAGKKATLDAVSRALTEVDVLHYCGHGFFHEPGGKRSGIELANDEWLRPENLHTLTAFPSVAIINACQGARMRTWRHVEGVSFAEHWLQQGLESYVSTTWAVTDGAAAAFAKVLYGALMDKHSLREAVSVARQHLFEANSPEWCNYVLYGSGDFRLLDRMADHRPLASRP